MNTGGCAPATPTQRQNLSLKAKIKDQTPAESVKDVLIVVVKDVLILDTFLPVLPFFVGPTPRRRPDPWSGLAFFSSPRFFSSASRSAQLARENRVVQMTEELLAKLLR